MPPNEKVEVETPGKAHRLDHKPDSLVLAMVIRVHSFLAQYYYIPIAAHKTAFHLIVGIAEECHAMCKKWFIMGQVNLR